MLIPAMSDLTDSQQQLADEIRRLCFKTHGKEHVLGWELVLFRACLGQAMLSTVDYSEMAHLLSLFRECNGWILHLQEGYKFVPRDEWARIMRTMEAK
jgi:hypothetical protein